MPDTLIVDIEIKLLIEAIYLKYKYDFREYNIASTRRRLKSALIAFNIKTISALQEKVLREPDFFMSVLQYLTISTTEMFRYPQYFKAFKEKVVPYLKSYPSIKIWVAGCSTGEEAYSFAILLHEEGLLERSIIYATDINPVSINKAQQGVYHLEDVKKYDVNYKEAGGAESLVKYYDIQNEMISFHEDLKKNIVFADHSLATDSVFSEMQFISCRNVLIYFDKPLQNRAIDLFHDSLSRKGFLGIGSKESLKFSSKENEFDYWATQERIYRRIN